MANGWVKNSVERKKIQRAYTQAHDELKERYPLEVPIQNFNNILKKKLAENEVYTQENLNYLRGFFRKNNILLYNPSTGYLKWSKID